MGFADKYIVPTIPTKDWNAIVGNYQKQQLEAEGEWLQKELELDSLDQAIKNLEHDIQNYHNDGTSSEYDYTKEAYYKDYDKYRKDLLNLRDIVDKYGVQSLDRKWIYQLNRDYANKISPIINAAKNKDQKVQKYMEDEKAGKHWLNTPKNVSLADFINDPYLEFATVNMKDYKNDLETAFSELADQLYKTPSLQMLADTLPTIVSQYGANSKDILSFINNIDMQGTMYDMFRNAILNVNNQYGITTSDYDQDIMLQGAANSAIYKALGKKDYTNIPSSLTGDGGNGKSTLRYNPMDTFSILDNEDAATYKSLTDDDGNLNVSNDFVKTFRDNLHVGSSYDTSSKELKDEITNLWIKMGKEVSKEDLFNYFMDDNFKTTETGKKILDYRKNNVKYKIMSSGKSVPVYPGNEIYTLFNRDEIYRKDNENVIKLLERMSGEKIDTNTTIEDVRRMLKDNKNPIDFGAYQDYNYALAGEALKYIYNNMVISRQTPSQGVKRGIFSDDASEYSINLNAKDKNRKPLYSENDILGIRYNPIQDKVYAYIRDRENDDNGMVILDISDISTSQDKHTRNLIYTILNNKELSPEDKKDAVSGLLNTLFSSTGNVTGTNNVN